VGVRHSWPIRFVHFLVFATSILTAAPRLRLSSATIGPVDIPVGSDGPTRAIETVNLVSATNPVALAIP